MSGARSSRRGRWLPVVVLALALYVVVRAATTSQGDSAPPSRSSTPTPSTAPAAPSTTVTPSSSYGPADYASRVRDRARQAGVPARLELRPDAAFGVADMHRATLDQVREGRDLAIEAET